MNDYKPIKSPLPLNHPLYGKRNPLMEEARSQICNQLYRYLLGRLLYLATRTRLDTSTETSMLGKFQNYPDIPQWKMLQNLVRYFKGTSDYLIFSPSRKNGKVDIESWADSDWARYEEQRCSRSGFVSTVNRRPIIGSSKLQTATTQSSTKAEFASLQSTVREVRCVKNVLN